eukprot:7590440-Pyramimonas_sp.AAC.1
MSFTARGGGSACLVEDSVLILTGAADTSLGPSARAPIPLPARTVSRSCAGVIWTPPPSDRSAGSTLRIMPRSTTACQRSASKGAPLGERSRWFCRPFWMVLDGSRWIR